MAKIHVQQQDKPSKVILEMDYDEAVWMTSLLGAVHHAHRIGKWNYDLYSTLHANTDIARGCIEIYPQIKATCSLNTNRDAVKPEPAKVDPEKWEFKFQYKDGMIRESLWNEIREQDICWPNGPEIVKVSFRKAQ